MANEKAIAFIERLKEDKSLRERFAQDPEGTLEKEQAGCTVAELREQTIMTRELDENELNSVSGGEKEKIDDCYSSFYDDECSATVEEGSWCWSNDLCVEWEKTYKPNLPQ